MIEGLDYDEIVDEIREQIGNDYATNSPAVANCYSRDFTTIAASRPNIVVMPGSTEDVQAVLKIANKYEIPVVVMSTGFNHGGLTICQRGGILVDLRRMTNLEIDEESMTATIGPGVIQRVMYYETIKIATKYNLKLKPVLTLSFGSTSVLGNYVSNGGGGWAGKYGPSVDLITASTWVLPDGEVVKTGPGAIPGAENVPLVGGPGPNISGMFFNSNGTMGICTEITIKLFPDKEHESLYMASSFDEDDEAACEQIIDFYYEIAQSNIQDVTYKNHSGLVAQTSGALADDDPLNLVGIMPKHPMLILVQGFTKDEVDIKSEIFREMCTRRNMAFLDPAEMGFGAYTNTLKFKASLGIDTNVIMSYKGAFQFCAMAVKMEDVPRIWKEWKEINKRYWSYKHDRPEEETMMAGFNLQGPMTFGRLGPMEVDWWWNHGDPEDIKRAALITRKFNEFAAKKGCFLFRNNFGGGHIALPLWGVYYDLLKETKNLIDPKNIMNPDVLPIGSDYLEV